MGKIKTAKAKTKCGPIWKRIKIVVDESDEYLAENKMKPKKLEKFVNTLYELDEEIEDTDNLSSKDKWWYNKISHQITKLERGLDSISTPDEINAAIEENNDDPTPTDDIDVEADTYDSFSDDDIEDDEDYVE